MIVEGETEMLQSVKRIAAFCEQGRGGNPAGVWIGEALPDARVMQAIAHEVGYSETAFAALQGDGWRVRYFAPKAEVPFCGHATIALGAALRDTHGEGRYTLVLNDDTISVDAQDGFIALQSPRTASAPMEETHLEAILNLFTLTKDDLDLALPPAWIEGGARHGFLALKDRERLSQMAYDFEAGVALMRALDVVTLVLAYAEAERHFHVRNAFAIGGVVEDPATGAAAAALSGYLRDVHWPHGGSLTILQGQEMGMPSRIETQIQPQKGTSIRVMGRTRSLN